MEGGIARWYDKTIRRDTPEIYGIGSTDRSACAGVRTVLEVAPGPGFLSIELANRGLDVQAVDISNACVGFLQQPDQARLSA